MRTDHPSLAIDAGVLDAYVQRSIADAARYAVLRDRLDAEPRPLTAGGELIRELLGEKRQWAIEHAFRALGILHPRQDLRSVYDAITGDDEGRRSAAREIVESMLPLERRMLLFSVLDELPPDERGARSRRTSPCSPRSWQIRASHCSASWPTRSASATWSR
jgi:hypothetical protein